MKILLAETKTMAFKRKEHIRTKIYLNNQTLEHILDFDYDISYFKNKGLDNKLHKFQHICESSSRILKNKRQKETKLKFNKAMATPTL